jgi:hypothetical protein
MEFTFAKFRSPFSKIASLSANGDQGLWYVYLIIWDVLMANINIHVF